MSLTGWIIAAPFIAIWWGMVFLVKGTWWLINALAAWLMRERGTPRS